MLMPLAEESNHLVLTLIPITGEILVSNSRQMEVQVDSEGFVRVDRYREGARARKINLRNDAKF